MLRGTSRRPDILILEPNVSPVVIETEVVPATNVEQEARARLGEVIAKSGVPILSSIAVRLPSKLRSAKAQELKTQIEATTDFEFALYTGDGHQKPARWPESGWLVGGTSDLSILAQSATIPPEIIDTAANYLIDGIGDVAALLEDAGKPHPGAIRRIAQCLHQEEGEQTLKMAGAILANAFVFHGALAGGPGDLSNVLSIDDIRTKNKWLSKSDILEEWDKILRVNYWPIFDIARQILGAVPIDNSLPILNRLELTSRRLLETRLMRSHDLTGAVFQRLIADRKFLAAFYTTPSSAAFLLGLALTDNRSPGKGSWYDIDAVRALRIADFACGTGTLLSAAYQRIGQLHELSGGSSEDIHSDMMATGLVGCDVLPAAAHLTASMLAGTHPTRKYDQSSILTVPYGKQEDGHVALGSLDLLASDGQFDIFGSKSKALEGAGETDKGAWFEFPDASFDMVVMNPPFTRATGHEGNKIGVPNPMFAAFSSNKEEQKLMGAATQKLTKGTSADGNAGEASIFLVLADRKLKLGGTLALVMPLSLMSGTAWEKSRQLLASSYSEIVAVSISGESGGDFSFSADTGMGECLIVGNKQASGAKRGVFIVLAERPPYPLIGANIASQVRRLIENGSVRRLEDGPTGATHIRIGQDVVGQLIDAPIPDEGIWNLSRIRDFSLAQTVFQIIEQGRLWLPGMSKSDSAEVNITTVANIGSIGPYHADINEFKSSGGGVRGPFKVTPMGPNDVATYPVLWSHDAEKERTMRFPADSQGQPLVGRSEEEQEVIEEKVQAVAASASHCHFNRDFRFNSQSTSMQFTPVPTIGGRSWTSIRMSSARLEKVLVLWSNSTLGILLYWWHANKQQSGRGSIGKSALESLPVFDVTMLSENKLSTAETLFDDLCEMALQPIHLIDKDIVRKQIDELFLSQVLGLEQPYVGENGSIGLLRRKLAKEPSILGSKVRST